MAAPGSRGRVSGASATPDEITVSGVMIEGIRHTCRVLQTQRRRYALVGPGTEALREGQQVTVTGREHPELINPCGLTFSVSSCTTT